MTTADLSPHADALLLVDLQQALVRGERAVPGAEALLARIQHLLDHARAAGVPVVHLQDDGDHLTRRETQGWRLALEPSPDEPVVEKVGDDGFVGTGLESVLRSAGATRLCLAGIQSEMCVAATARGALARGFTVVLPREGHATYDVPAEGSAPAVPAAAVSRVAEWSLGSEVVLTEAVGDVVFEVAR